MPAKFPGKYLCWSLTFNKVAGMCGFYLFYRIPLATASDQSYALAEAGNRWKMKSLNFIYNIINIYIYIYIYIIIKYIYLFIYIYIYIYWYILKIAYLSYCTYWIQHDVIIIMIIIVIAMNDDNNHNDNK